MALASRTKLEQKANSVSYLLMNKKLLSESTSVPVATGAEGRWRATFITPGTGSSGEWKEEVLRRDGPHALKAGSRCFITHNRLPNGEPDPMLMWGVLAEDASYEDGVGLVGEIQVLKSWRERVEEVAPHTALSVYLWADADESTGEITRIYEDEESGVDLVVHPGRPGSALIEKMYESAKRNSEKATATSAEEHEEGSEVVSEVTDAIKALEAHFDAKFEALLATKTQEAQAEVDADAIAKAKKEAVEQFDAQADLIAKAELLPAQEAELKARLKDGEDITQALESAKVVAKEARDLGAGSGQRASESGRYISGERASESGDEKPVNLKGLFS